MSDDVEVGFYVRGRTALRPAVIGAVLSLFLTAGTFAALPFLSFLSEREHGTVTLRQAPDASLDVPPPPSAEEKQYRKPKSKQRPKINRKPKIRQARQRISPLDVRFSLGMSSLVATAGDFSLGFAVESPAPGPEVVPPPICEAAQLDRRPRAVSRVRPIYPLRARQRGIEGFVELAFVIEADGRISHIRVVNSEPGDLFVRTAIAAVKRWRFAPGEKDGKPVASRVSITVRFELE